MEAYQALAGVYDRLMDEEERRQWVGSTLRLLEEYGLRSGDEVLDLACGTGAISIPLARAGYRVTALDLNGEMLEEARKKPFSKHVTWIRGDMADFVLHRPVRAVSCACDGVNYLTDMDTVRRCFSAVSRALVPGGLFLFDVSTDKKLTEMDGQLYGLDEEDVAYLWRNRMEPASRVLTMDITFFLRKDRDSFLRRDEIHHQRAHTRQELETALEACGFRVEKVTDGLTDAPASETSMRHRYIALKYNAN